MWQCMRESGVVKYVRALQDMYDDSVAVGMLGILWLTVRSEVKITPRLGLETFLVWVVMYRLTGWIIWICSDSREQVRKRCDRWKHSLQKRRVKVSRNKTQYTFVNERENIRTARMQGIEAVKSDYFIFLGSAVKSKREWEVEVEKKVNAWWSWWWIVSRVHDLR